MQSKLVTQNLSQQATTAPFTSRVASAAGRLRSDALTGHVRLADGPQNRDRAENSVNSDLGEST